MTLTTNAVDLSKDVFEVADANRRYQIVDILIVSFVSTADVEGRRPHADSNSQANTSG